MVKCQGKNRYGKIHCQFERSTGGWVIYCLHQYQVFFPFFHIAENNMEVVSAYRCIRCRQIHALLATTSFVAAVSGLFCSLGATHIAQALQVLGYKHSTLPKAAGTQSLRPLSDGLVSIAPAGSLLLASVLTSPCAPSGTLAGVPRASGKISAYLALCAVFS